MMPKNVALLIYHLFAKHLPDLIPFSVVGYSLRTFLCRHIFSSCGDGLRIGPDVDFGRGRQLQVGNDVCIGRQVQINLNDHVKIGDRSIIGDEVLFYTQDHGHTSKDVVMQKQPYQCAPITIGSDVRIGPRSIILKGVTVGDGAVIEIGSVVTKNVKPGSIVIGIPAKEIGDAN